ncbi:accessory Sec system S-layer assembly protein [Priestia koreensis]|uniref:Accessory Sec system S-layer assembly protein n=1 Tax=Priestia koreensis TaxID=284581 RepID=A0A0M0KEI5_9BACI|nr:accessory Sec system S-layer assembly protein [Priestia koreensis]KOO37214.1 hypothetical protein AMD01_22295 [Priestia koreensis]
MASFLKKWRKNKEKVAATGQESVVSSADLLNEQPLTAAPDEDVYTALSFDPSWNLDSEDKYVYQYLNNELPPLKPNQISLSGIDLKPEDNFIQVMAFIRNSLPKAIKFEETTLLLVGPNGDVLARKAFDLSNLGEIPENSSRPAAFLFEPGSLLAKEIPLEGWKLAFELKKAVKHQLDLPESWKTSLPQSEQDKLHQIVESLEPPQEGEVNFYGLQAGQNEERDLHVTVLIRNGSDRNMQIQHLPLQMEDASGEIIAQGSFQFDDFEVKANTTKPWTFIFPHELIKKDELDFSRWRVMPIQNEE